MAMSAGFLSLRGWSPACFGPHPNAPARWGALRMGSEIGGIFTLGVFGAFGFVIYRLGYEARSRTMQALGVAVVFLLICAAAGMLY